MRGLVSLYILFVAVNGPTFAHANGPTLVHHPIRKRFSRDARRVSRWQQPLSGPKVLPELEQVLANQAAEQPVTTDVVI